MGDVLEHRVRVFAVEERRIEDAVVVVVGATHGIEVGRCRVLRSEDLCGVERDRDLGARAEVADDGHGRAMGEHQMVRREESLQFVRVAGRVVRQRVGQEGRAPGFVERGPVADAVTESTDHGRGILPEPRCRVTAQPASAVVEHLRQVPVVKRDEGANPVVQQLIDEAIVEVDPFRVHGPDAVGDDPWPRHREAIGVEPERLHHHDVLWHSVVVLARRVPGVLVRDIALDRGEGVPDGGRSTPFRRRTLDLEGCGRRAPEEPVGEGGVEGHASRYRDEVTHRERCGLVIGQLGNEVDAEPRLPLPRAVS